MASSHVFSVVARDFDALAAAFMPFIAGGGLFFPVEIQVQLSDTVFVMLQLPGQDEQLAFCGRVVWITPSKCGDGSSSGIGVQIHDPEGCVRPLLDACLQKSRKCAALSGKVN